jgi:hypothetical protein
MVLQPSERGTLHRLTFVPAKYAKKRHIENHLNSNIILLTGIDEVRCLYAFLRPARHAIVSRELILLSRLELVVKKSMLGSLKLLIKDYFF